MIHFLCHFGLKGPKIHSLFDPNPPTLWLRSRWWVVTSDLSISAGMCGLSLVDQVFVGSVFLVTITVVPSVLIFDT